jgi:hypothetical protein
MNSSAHDPNNNPGGMSFSSAQGVAAEHGAAFVLLPMMIF